MCWNSVIVRLRMCPGPKRKHDANERLEGHKKALGGGFGVAFQPAILVEGDYKEDGGVLAMQQLLQSGEKFTAVVCANDQMVSGAISVCLEQGIPGTTRFIFCRLR